MDVEIEVTGNTMKVLEEKAQSIFDRFYGYSRKVKQMNNRKKPPVEEFVYNPTPCPYEMSFGTVHIKSSDSYDPVFIVLVKATTDTSDDDKKESVI